jgi:hypothetical protein
MLNARRPILIGRLLKVVCFCAMFALGIVIASKTATGDIMHQGQDCIYNSNCSGVPPTLNGACPPVPGTDPPVGTNCTFSGASGTYTVCKVTQDGGVCWTNQPYIQETCNGACAIDTNIGCSISYNLCYAGG